MDKDDLILKKLEEHEAKLNAIFVSVEKTRKYFMWTLIITVITVVLPLIGLGIVIPLFVKSIQLPAGL